MINYVISSSFFHMVNSGRWKDSFCNSFMIIEKKNEKELKLSFDFSTFFFRLRNVLRKKLCHFRNEENFLIIYIEFWESFTCDVTMSGWFISYFCNYNFHFLTTSWKKSLKKTSKNFSINYRYVIFLRTKTYCQRLSINF